MATQVLALRLQEEQLQVLQKMADSKGLKVSELVKDMIASGIAGAQSGAESNTKLMQKLQEVEKRILGSQSWLADAAMKVITESVAARLMAEAAAGNSDELISFLVNQTQLDQQTKAQWQANRANEAINQAQAVIDAISVQPFTLELED